MAKDYAELVSLQAGEIACSFCNFCNFCNFTWLKCEQISIVRDREYSRSQSEQIFLILHISIGINIFNRNKCFQSKWIFIEIKSTFRLKLLVIPATGEIFGVFNSKPLLVMESENNIQKRGLWRTFVAGDGWYFFFGFQSQVIYFIFEFVTGNIFNLNRTGFPPLPWFESLQISQKVSSRYLRW